MARAREIGIALVALVALGAGCDRRTGGGSTDGPELFARLCAGCHGPTGKPDATLVARTGVRDLTDPAVRATLTPARVATQIRQGSPNNLMPPFEGALTDAQIEALAAYVASPAFYGPR